MNSNVVGLNEVRQNRDLKEDNRDVLEAMFVGIERSRFGSLENMALEIADKAPLEILKLLARYYVGPPDNKD